ncbi:DUF924 family protein [Pseudanabaena sp. FACHB-2040]|uniref:DUF924 family protein n=1 Tax=Pseudanabaena sp. FACHB-2040 TaxID=2692859 RepID=UPI001683D893|nr:DUF924 family protein [Pseudanabaena sp. FACHB-2040]MBD2256073.1 DUF924 domain-containing protein [Pseudanabaena sp. FACHB-2040]
MDRVEAILNFWFGDPMVPDSEYGQQRQVWFKKDPAFDETLRTHFLEDYEQAAAGQLSDWQTTARPCLALILLLDQLPRNLFRNAPRSFATDGQALAAARYAVQQGFDQLLTDLERIFVYLPLEHSENLADQQESVRLFQALAHENPELETNLDYALRHQEVIERFGRFPHRNEILGRESTPAEAEFLTQPGSRF